MSVCDLCDGSGLVEGDDIGSGLAPTFVDCSCLSIRKRYEVRNKEEKRASLERDFAELADSIRRHRVISARQHEEGDYVGWSISRHRLRNLVKASDDVDRKLAELDMTWGERLFGPLLGAEWVSRFLSLFGRKSRFWRRK